MNPNLSRTSFRRRPTSSRSRCRTWVPWSACRSATTAKPPVSGPFGLRHRFSVGTGRWSRVANRVVFSSTQRTPQVSVFWFFHPTSPLVRCASRDCISSNHEVVHREAHARRPIILPLTKLYSFAFPLRIFICVVLLLRYGSRVVIEFYSAFRI